MFIDPLKILKQENITAESYSILAQRPGNLVIKVITEQDTLVLKANKSPNDTTWDAINARRLAAVGIPTPEIIAQAESPCSYVITRWIEGEPLSIHSPISTQIEAGRILRHIHTFPERPHYNNSFTWEKWMSDWLKICLDWWGEQKSITKSMVANAQKGFDAIRPLLRNRGNQFMLQDGRPEHFIIRGNKIVGLIDVHDAQPGDGAMDLGVIGVFDKDLLNNILKGYEMDAAEGEVINQLIPFYIFIRRLAAAEWHSHSGSAVISERALELATKQPFLLK